MPASSISLQTFARFDHAGGEGVTNSYDAIGRLLTSTTSMSGLSRSVTRVRDDVANRITLTYGGQTYRYEFDDAGRLTDLYEDDGTTLNRGQDPQALLDRYAGTGERASTAERGMAGFKERITTNEQIGIYRQRLESGSYVDVPTNRAIIIYGRTGSHIVPSSPSTWCCVPFAQ